VLNVVLEAGARLARPGEFTLRAFLNGRLDLTQVGSISPVNSIRGIAGVLRQGLEAARSHSEIHGPHAAHRELLCVSRRTAGTGCTITRCMADAMTAVPLVSSTSM